MYSRVLFLLMLLLFSATPSQAFIFLLFASQGKSRPASPNLPPAPPEELLSDLARPPRVAQAQPADEIQRLKDRIRELEAKQRANAPAIPPSGTRPDEKEIPGWRVRLFPYTPDLELRFKDYLFTHYYLNGKFDFRMGHNRRDTLQFTYVYEAVFRASKPGAYVFGVDLRCNKMPSISSCNYAALVDGTVRDKFSGRNLNGIRRTFRIQLTEPKELVIALMFTGSQTTYMQIHQDQFTIMPLVRGPDDTDFRDFRQRTPPYELFVRVPRSSSITPGRYQ